MSRGHGWLVGGEPTRRCGRAFTRPDGKRAVCGHPVFVVHFRVGMAFARYACVNVLCRRYDEATALRYNR